MKLPDKFAESNSFTHVVLCRRCSCSGCLSPRLYNLWRAGEGSGSCAVCPHTGGGGSQWHSRSVAGTLGNIIRIQHTACKMQQMGSSLEWQLWVCCHTELQLACQSKTAPRSFLYLPPSLRILHSPPSFFRFSPSPDPDFTLFPPLPHLTKTSSPSILSTQPSHAAIYAGQVERKYL